MAKVSINISKIKLKDIMRKENIVKINQNSAAGDAAKLMLKNRIHSLPVVDEGNEEKNIKYGYVFRPIGFNLLRTVLGRYRLYKQYKNRKINRRSKNYYFSHQMLV